MITGGVPYPCLTVMNYSGRHAWRRVFLPARPALGGVLNLWGGGRPPPPAGPRPRHAPAPPAWGPASQLDVGPRLAAIDVDAGAGDPRGPLRSQEDGHRRHLLRPAEA